MLSVIKCETNKMNRYNKILLSLLIGLSFIFLMEMDVFHHHPDNGLHNECPVCVLNTIISAIAVLSSLVFLFRPAVSRGNSVPVYASELIQNYSSYYYPDRAPPRI